jgi:uncharacterized membrane protein (DUF106 family)
MGLLGNIIKNEATNLITSVGDAFDKNFTSEEERLAQKNLLLEKANDLLEKLQNAQKEIIMSESTGNWLQRSWRPIVMLMFSFIVVYTYFLQPAFFPNAIKINEILPERFWNLLELGMGGYVIGRSAEKIAGSVANVFSNAKTKK